MNIEAGDLVAVIKGGTVGQIFRCIKPAVFGKWWTPDQTSYHEEGGWILDRHFKNVYGIWQNELPTSALKKVEQLPVGVKDEA